MEGLLFIYFGYLFKSIHSLINFLEKKEKERETLTIQLSLFCKKEKKNIDL